MKKDSKLCLILHDFQYLLANMKLDMLLAFKDYDLFNKKMWRRFQFIYVVLLLIPINKYLILLLIEEYPNVRVLSFFKEEKHIKR